MSGLDRRSFMALAAAAAAPGMAWAAPKPSAFQAAWADVAATWRRDLTEGGYVGASLAFAQDGRRLATELYGYADLETKRPVDLDTLFHWASITKVFTGVAVMQLRDQGRLKLEDPVVGYLPELKEVRDPFGPIDQITIRHLLTHSAGFRSPTWPWGGDKPWHPHEPARWSQIAAMMPYTEIEFAPGSKHSYSNPGMSMAGRIIEVVTGESYEAHVEKNVLRPLGMLRSYFDLTPPYELNHRSNNYRRLKDGKLITNGLELDTGATVANGGLNGPVDDMMRFTDFLLGVGDTTNHSAVLSRGTLQEMFTPAGVMAEDPKYPSQVGLTFFIVDHPEPEGGNVHFIGHAGYQTGYRSFMHIVPAARAAVVVVANTNRQGDDVWNVHLRDGLYDRVAPALSAPVRTRS